jgi:hypothetical protein
MPVWLQKLTGKRGGSAEEPPVAPRNVARFEPAPDFSTKLAIDAPGGPGRAGAEALYKKWSSKWQEF